MGFDLAAGIFPRIQMCTGYQAAEKLGNTDYLVAGRYMHWWGETPASSGMHPRYFRHKCYRSTIASVCRTEHDVVDEGADQIGRPVNGPEVYKQRKKKQRDAAEEQLPGREPQ